MDISVAKDVAHWLRRARDLIPRADRRVLLSPPRLVRRFLQFAELEGRGKAAHLPADDITARDPELLDLLCDGMRAIARIYFGLRVDGIEHVPAHGPVLLVGNHSGGLVATEGPFTLLAIRDAHGIERAVYPLAHDFLFEDDTLRRFAARLGVLRAGHDSARRALAAGHAVLVYPGSDLDTFRPFRDRNRIVLGGREGFVRLALREQVPIVPVVAIGTHEQLIVLTRGDRLARLLHAHRWARTDVLPIIAALPWGITLGWVPYLPLPARTTLAFLPPMRWPELGPAAADDADAVERCYREVERAMQAELDRLARDHQFLLGPKTTCELPEEAS